MKRSVRGYLEKAHTSLEPSRAPTSMQLKHSRIVGISLNLSSQSVRALRSPVLAAAHSTNRNTTPGEFGPAC